MAKDLRFLRVQGSRTNLQYWRTSAIAHPKRIKGASQDTVVTLLRPFAISRSYISSAFDKISAACSFQQCPQDIRGCIASKTRRYLSWMYDLETNFFSKNTAIRSPKDSFPQIEVPPLPHRRGLTGKASSIRARLRSGSPFLRFSAASFSRTILRRLGERSLPRRFS